MTLSNAKVLPLLQKNFVCGWRNIAGKEKYAGRSGTYQCDNPAVTTTNGAGSKNIQFIFSDAEGRILLVLPGYWNPEDFRTELDFCLELAELAGADAPDNRRNDAFMLAHLNHAVKLAQRTSKNSKLQGFDENTERGKGDDSAFKKRASDDPRLKTVDQVVHEKMAELPFLRWEDFDVGRFVDYGTRFYDKRVPGTVMPGPNMPTPKPARGS